MRWCCSKCGEMHEGIPDSYAFDAPWPWYVVPEQSRTATSVLSETECILNDEDYFIAGCLEIPVIGRSTPLVWGVWVSLSRTNFERQRSLLREANRVGEPLYFGWLSSRIQIYPNTLLLKTHVHTRPVGMKPYIELEPTEHPLAIEQRTGITESRLREIAEVTQHNWLHPEWDRKGFYGGAH